MSIINEALQKAGGIKETGVENIVKDAEKPGTKLPVNKKIAFGDNFRRFSQWYGKVFYTFLYQDKRVLHYKWIYSAGIPILLITIILALFLRKESAVKENPALQEVVSPVQLSIVEQSPVNTVADNPLPISQGSLPDISEFKLTGIVLGEGAPMAIINESVYMKGDTIKDLKIAEITKNTVSLEKDGRRLELRVK